MVGYFGEGILINGANIAEVPVVAHWYRTGDKLGPSHVALVIEPPDLGPELD
jgi:hypothetical protein